MCASPGFPHAFLLSPLYVKPSTMSTVCLLVILRKTIYTLMSDPSIYLCGLADTSLAIWFPHLSSAGLCQSSLPVLLLLLMTFRKFHVFSCRQFRGSLLHVS